MKVLFYISTIRGGGAARVMTNLANRFVRDTAQVVFVTNFTDINEYRLSKSVKRFSIEDTESKRNVFIKNIKRICALRRLICNENPDIVVSFMHENDVRAYLATRWVKTKLLLSVRNDPKAVYKSKMKGCLAKYIYRHCDGVVFQTEEAKDWFGRINGKSRIIMNQVAEEFYNTNTEEIVRKNIVTTGKFMEQKNHKLLIDAYKMIESETNEDLIIYGDGKLREQYQEYIKALGLEQRVLLPGNISNVAESIKDAKVFVMTSDYEGMPNSLMEAMALGLPCISTDCPCGGPRALIDHGKNGLLIQVGDTETLAQYIKELLKKSEWASQIGEEAQIKAKSFKPDMIYKQWKTFLEELVL